MVIYWETLNLTRCFIHQTNSNHLNFHGIEWFYDWSSNKQIIQDQSWDSNCGTPCRNKIYEAPTFLQPPPPSSLPLPPSLWTGRMELESVEIYEQGSGKAREGMNSLQLARDHCPSRTRGQKRPSNWKFSGEEIRAMELQFVKQEINLCHTEFRLSKL